jgi:hypothetical protein
MRQTKEESMRLSKTHKRAIVRKIMEDIPRKDYGQIINDIVQAKAYDLMPNVVKAVYDNKDTRGFVCRVHCAAYGEHVGSVGPIYWMSIDGYHLNINRAHYHSNDSDLTKKLLEDIKSPVEKAMRRAEEQGRSRRSMEQKLTTMLAGITTLRQAKTLLEEELHKYLPVEPPKDEAQKAAQASTALVPYVVANLREMGWPKEDQQPTEGSN